MSEKTSLYISEIDDICAAALIEAVALKGVKQNNKVLGIDRPDWGKYGKYGVIENTMIAPHQSRVVVSMSEKPVSIKFFGTDKFPKDAKVTNGIYYVRYVPKCLKSHKEGKPYVIGNDLLGFRLTVSGPQHFKALGDRIPEIAWMRRNTNFNDGLFRFAKEHPDMRFYFTVDWTKLGLKIEAEAERLGIDINHAPFVSRRCSEEEFEKLYKTICVQLPKSKMDYMKELLEAENIPSVQMETKTDYYKKF